MEIVGSNPIGVARYDFILGGGAARRGNIGRKSALPNVTFTFTDATRQFTTHLEAGLKSPETITSYRTAIHQTQEFLSGIGLPDNVTALTREHLELFIADLGKRVSGATVVNRFKGLRAFFTWLHAEGEITDNPMARMEWPKIEEKPPSACTPEEVRAMIADCGRDFAGRRDTALIAFMVDTGWRVSEVLAVTVDMVRERGSLSVPAKGKRTVTARLTPYVQSLIDRYLRVRNSTAIELWLSRSDAPMDRHAVWEVLAARSKAARIKHVPPSQAASHPCHVVAGGRRRRHGSEGEHGALIGADH